MRRILLTICLAGWLAGCYSITPDDGDAGGASDRDTSLPEDTNDRDASTDTVAEDTDNLVEDTDTGVRPGGTDVTLDTGTAAEDTGQPVYGDWRDANYEDVDILSGPGSCTIPCGVPMLHYPDYPNYTFGATIWIDPVTGEGVLVNDQDAEVDGMGKGMVFAYENNQYGYSEWISSSDPFDFTDGIEYAWSADNPNVYSHPQYEPLRITLLHEPSGQLVTMVYMYGDRETLVHSITLQ